MESRGLERYAPLAGFAFFVLAVASEIVGGSGQPDVGDPTPKVVAYWLANDAENIVSALLGGLAALMLVWFGASLRSSLLRAEGGAGRLATLAFTGTVVAALSLAIASSVQFAAADTVGDVPPAVTQTLSVLAFEVWLIPVVVGAALLMFAAGLAALRFHTMPRWAGYTTLVIGVACFIVLGVVLAAIWIAAVSLTLFREERHAAVAPTPTGAAPVT